MRKSKTLDKIPHLSPDVEPKVVPAPTDGLDAISPLAEMDPKRANILDNWIPRPGYVELRGGYVPFSSTGATSPVESLMVRRSPTGEKMFAAAGTKIFDVSSAALAGTAVVTGLSNSRWQYINFTPGNGTTVIQCVNGADQLQMYDGASWTVPSITGFPNGWSTANIVHINSQKRRIWYVMFNSSIICFMPTDAIQGPIAGYLDLGALWSKGGFLVAMSAWTIDGGSGPQDYALFISSRGQATIYSGIDPTNASNWNLVGTFDVSPPVGRRCLYRLGSDVGIITEQGVIPISQALPFDPSADRSVALTARIQNAMVTATQLYSGNFGWQLISYPNQQLIFLNVPLVTNSNQIQFVMNALTGGWGRVTGWNANCFEIYNDNLYWGDNVGLVHQGFVGSNDNTNSISADMQCAFNWFEEPGRAKRMTLVQPLLTLGGNLTPTIGVDVDFSTSTATAPVTTFTSTVLWDKATWDVSLWPAESINYTGWLSVNAIGHALAVRMQVNINAISSASGMGVFDSAIFDLATFDTGLSTSLPLLRVNAFNAILELGAAI